MTRDPTDEARYINIGPGDEAFALLVVERILDDRSRFAKGYGKTEACTYTQSIENDKGAWETCFHGYQEETGEIVVEKILEKYWEPGEKLIADDLPADPGQWTWYGDNERDQQQRRG